MGFSFKYIFLNLHTKKYLGILLLLRLDTAIFLLICSVLKKGRRNIQINENIFSNF